MSCRLITDGKAAQAQAITWSPVGRALSRPQEGRQATLYSDSGAEGSTAGESEPEAAAAYQRGLRDGDAGATQRLAGQVSAKIEQLGRSIEQLALHRGKIQREAEPELVRLSLAIARRILRRELTVDPEALLGLVKAGLEKIESSELHRVRVHPDHAPILTRLLEDAARRVDVAADPGLPVGAVIFETSRGSLDSGLDTQLQEIERGFADIYPR
jgi:flagellar assembly protein FliH